MIDNVTRWSLSRINEGYRMTRINNTRGWIEDRPLTRLEIIWFWITRRLKKFYFSCKED